MVPNSFETRYHCRQTVRDPKRLRPSGFAMMAATAASTSFQNTTLANPWFRARAVHLGTQMNNVLLVLYIMLVI